MKKMKKILILVSAVALIAAFTIPASAADEIKWNWYGDARVRTFWVSEDFQESGTTVGGNDSTEDSELEWQFQGNSRIGFRVKGGAVGGRVELRTNDDNATGSSSTNDANFARLWGSWNFGAGTLYVGKRQPPIYQFLSGQIYDDTGGIGYGMAYSRRRGQVALGFGGFEVAFIQPREDALGTNGDSDPMIPKVEARWGMGFDTWNFNLMGGVQYYEISNATNNNGNNKDVDVTSYFIGGDVTFNFGPFYTKAGVNYAQNPGPADWVGPSPAFDGDDSTDDVTRMGYGLVLGFKLTDMVTFEGGAIGYSDDYDATGFGNGSGWTAYLQAVLQMHPGVFFIPEFSYFNDEDSGQGAADGPTKWALGGKWQINF
jgi:hypothetical protein